MAIIHETEFYITQIKNNVSSLTGASEDDIKIVTINGDDKYNLTPPLVTYRAAVLLKIGKTEAHTSWGHTNARVAVRDGTERCFIVLYEIPADLTRSRSMEEAIRQLMNKTADEVGISWTLDYFPAGYDAVV